MVSSHGWPRTSSDTSPPQGAVDVGASVVWQQNKSQEAVRVPTGTSCLFPLLHYHLPPSVSPFIYSLSLAPSRSHPGIWWIGVGGYSQSGSGYGKRQNKHYKERGFSFQFLKPPPLNNENGHKIKKETNVGCGLKDFFSQLRLRWF